jgi:methionine biosynthesis protein MetW
MYKIPWKIFPIIEDWVQPGSRVLDLGCGDGALLGDLIRSRQVEGIGVEISQDMIVQCLQRGISVYQADIDRGLSQWDDLSFDYVILNDTLQVITRPREVIAEMLRVGRHAIISVSNFAYLGNRLRVLFQGRMSREVRFTGSWNDTPVIRFVSLREFRASLGEMGVDIVDSRLFLPFSLVAPNKWLLGDLLAMKGIFKLRRGA